MQNWVFLTCVWSLQVCLLVSARPWYPTFSFCAERRPWLQFLPALSLAVRRNQTYLKVLPVWELCDSQMFAETQVCHSKNKAAFISWLVYSVVGAFFRSGKAVLAFIFLLAM